MQQWYVCPIGRHVNVYHLCQLNLNVLEFYLCLGLIQLIPVSYIVQPPTPAHHAHTAKAAEAADTAIPRP